MPFEAVCASTTRWANLMQHILNGGGAPSHILSIRVFMAWMLSQVSRSCALPALDGETVSHRCLHDKYAHATDAETLRLLARLMMTGWMHAMRAA